MQAHQTMEGVVSPGDDSLVQMRRAANDQASVSATASVHAIATSRHHADPPALKWLRPPKYDRLHSALVAFEEEWTMGTLEDKRREHAPKVAKLIASATEELNARHYHAGWASLQAAVRIRLLSTSRPTFEAWARSLAEEAEHKLSGWRLASARELLSFLSERDEGSDRDSGSPHDAAPDPVELARIHDVQLLIDGGSQNTYAKQRVIVSRALALLSILVGLIVLAIALIGSSSILVAGTGATGGLRFAVLIAAFGGMGASFSGLRSVFGAASKSVPEVILSGWFTCMRPAIGAAAALVVWLAQIGGVVNLGEGSPAGLFLLAFVAGFSDALVVRVVGTVGKKE